MPALPAVDNVLKAQLTWSDSEDVNVVSNHFFRYTGAPPNSAAATLLSTDIVDAMLPHNDQWGETTILTGCKVTDLSTVTGGVGETAVSQLGTIVSPPLAGGTAVVVNYQLARRYRGGKPRNYLPWLSSASLVNRQTWGSTDIVDVADAMEAFYSACIGSTASGCTIASHCNVSYYDGFTVVTNPVTGRARNAPKLRATPVVDDVTGLTVLGRPGSQRRRNK